MWQFIVPAIAGLTGAIAAERRARSRPSAESSGSRAQSRTVLASNLERLEKELRANQNCWRLAVLGQPGAGKSTLLVKLTRNGLMPAPSIGIETDATDWSKDEDENLIRTWNTWAVVDMPGHGTSAHPARRYLEGFPFSEVDALVFVVSGKIRDCDNKVYKAVKSHGLPVFTVRCNSDALFEDEEMGSEDQARAHAEADLRSKLGMDGEAPVFFISNRFGEGIDELKKALMREKKRWKRAAEQYD
jgi:predicted GTPase